MGRRVREIGQRLSVAQSSLWTLFCETRTTTQRPVRPLHDNAQESSSAHSSNDWTCPHWCLSSSFQVTPHSPILRRRMPSLPHPPDQKIYSFRIQKLYFFFFAVFIHTGRFYFFTC